MDDALSWKPGGGEAIDDSITGGPDDEDVPGVTEGGGKCEGG